MATDTTIPVQYTQRGGDSGNTTGDGTDESASGAGGGGYSASNAATQGDVSQSGGEGGAVTNNFGDDPRNAAVERGSVSFPAWAAVAIALLALTGFAVYMKRR